MDGSRFDAWTRRRFGLAAGSVAGSLLALIGRDDAEAKKKRCRKPGQSCKSSGKKKKCCKKLVCQTVPGFSDGKVCCRELEELCDITAEEPECCSGLCIGQCICKSIGESCEIDANCCSLNCGADDKCAAPF